MITMFSEQCHTSFFSFRHSAVSPLFLLRLLPAPHSRFSLARVFTLGKKASKDFSAAAETMTCFFFCCEISKLKVFVWVDWRRWERWRDFKKNNAAYSCSESVHHSLTGREQSPVRYTKQPAAFSRVLNNRGGISDSDSLLHFNFLLSHHYTLFLSCLMLLVSLFHVYFFPSQTSTSIFV